MSDAEREVLEQIKRIGIIPPEVGDRASREFPSSEDSTSESGGIQARRPQPEFPFRPRSSFFAPTPRWTLGPAMIAIAAALVVLDGMAASNLALNADCALSAQLEKSSPPIPFAGRKAGEIRDDNGLKTKLVWCPPGSFRMGSPQDEPDRDDDEDQVDVTLKSGVWLGQCEVTQAEWQAVMGTTIRDQAAKSGAISFYGEGPNDPMYYVSHDEAREFCRKLSDRERAAGRLPAGCEYRLPTEAEWEYGCRAGATTATAFGAKLSSRQANFDGDFPYNGAEKGPDLSKTQEVGRYSANPWNLRDMHGNVWEWCLDVYKQKLPGGIDPSVSDAGSVADRVHRGGGWNDLGKKCRSAYRSRSTSVYRLNDLGFRLALGPSRP